jgi:hypothetical protein
MARTALTPQEIGTDRKLNPIVWTAGDATNNHQVANPNPGNIYVLLDNAGASPCVVDIASAASGPEGRTNNISSESVAAGNKAVFGPFPPQLWNQTGGILTIDIDQDSSVTLAVVRGLALP